MSKQNSLVDDTWDALYDLLDSQSWPSHPKFGPLPKVYFADLDEPQTEAIVVAGVPALDSQANDATFGSTSSTEEEFTLRILLGSKVPGCNRDDARLRQKELCGIVQAALRSTTTGKPAGSFNTVVPGILWWRRTRYAPQLYPLPENGWGFYAELDYLFHAHI